MKYIDLQKKVTKNILLSLLGFILMFAFIIPGAIIEDKNEDSILGMILIVLGVLIVLGITLFIVVYAIKSNKSLKESFKDYIKEQVYKYEGKSLFKTIDNKNVVFNNDHLLLDDKVYYYSEFDLIAVVKRNRKMLYDEVIPGILFSVEENVEEFIPLDNDLLSLIKSNNIPILNKEDLYYFIDNIDETSWTIKKKMGWDPHALYFMLEFAKNNEEKKIKNKRNKKAILIWTLIIFLSFGFMVFSAWFFNSESGVKISSSFASELIFKLLISGIIILLALYKNEKIKLLSRSFFVTYLIIYWFTLLFLNYKAMLVINLVFLFIFGILSYLNYDFKPAEANQIKRKNPMNRFMGFSLYLAIILMMSSFDINYVNDNEPFIISGIIALIIFILSPLVILLLKNKIQKKYNISNGKYWGLGIGTGFFVAFVTLYLIAITAGIINYSFDTSKGKVFITNIVDKKLGSDNSSDYFVVIINDKEVEINISTEEYYKIKIGDQVELTLYEGLLGWEYYEYIKD